MTAIETQQFIMRPPSFDDLPAAVDLFNLCSIAEIGAPEFTIEGITTEWNTPRFNLDTDTRTAWTEDGQLVGYIEVWTLGNPLVRMHTWTCVHPDYAETALQAHLLEWGEQRARQEIHRAPEGAMVTLETGGYSHNTTKINHFTNQGFELRRYFLRMIIELESEPAQAVWPAGITIRTANPDTELERIAKAIDESFKDHWGHIDEDMNTILERWRHWMTEPNFDPALWFIAEDGDEIAGFAICWKTIDEDPKMGWIGTLGVLRPWRRLGLGLALLQHAFGEFYQRGQERVGLGVDAQSLTGATKLYERAGMHAAERKYANFQKILREGTDMRTQTVEA